MAMFVQILGDEATCHDHSAFLHRGGLAKILIDPFPSVHPSRDNGWERLPYRQELDTGR